MKRLLLVFLIVIVIPFLLSAQTGSNRNASSKTAGPPNITGYYQAENENSIEALLLKDGRVKFYIMAMFRDHTGEICGVAPMKDNIVVYKKDACEITLKFETGRIIVTQKGSDADCEFGMNVNAAGVYRKRNSKIPEFTECRES